MEAGSAFWPLNVVKKKLDLKISIPMKVTEKKADVATYPTSVNF